MSATGTREPRPIARPLLAWFAAAGRADLPWRVDRAPYRVVVAEFMLQQTQVERVIPLFEAFVRRWPSFAELAAASRGDVLRAWKGLGYNSRAVRLHELARAVESDFGGTLPREVAELEALPGVGPYTARAIAAFAFDRDVVAADTNVRRVVHRTQFGVEHPPVLGSRELDAFAASLLPAGSGFAFNSALMDLGATLCTARAPKCLLCPLAAACAAAPLEPARLAALAQRHARPRSPQNAIAFEATTRFARGRIVDRLRELGPQERISPLDLHAAVAARAPASREPRAFSALVASLAAEGLVECDERGIRLRD